MTAYSHALPLLLRREALPQELATGLMSEILDLSLEASQVGAVLALLASRPPQGEELGAFAQVMRDRCVPIEIEGPSLDSCGTGGSGLPTANTSTAVAFVLAAAGVPVVKHGNRASSGRCGSSDVLEALGIALESTPKGAQVQFAQHGIAFVFAPSFHPALGPLAPLRRALGTRTVFNLLGPLCNPARPSHQVLGVSSLDAGPAMAHALSQSTEAALVVAGEDGLDEISLSAPTRCWRVEAGEIDPLQIDPESLGLERQPHAAYCGGDVETNTKLLLDVLGGRSTAAHRDHVALNAGAAFWVWKTAETLQEGLDMAQEVLYSSKALQLLHRLSGEPAGSGEDQ